MHSKKSTPIKLETCNENVLCQLWVKYCVVKEFIVECYLAIKLKTAHFRTIFMWDVCFFCVKNSLLKFVPSILYTSCTLLQFFVVLRAKKIRGHEVILVFNFGCIFPRCTNPGRQVARANKFCMATPVFVGSQYGSYLISPFWWQEFWGGFYIFEKVVPPCITQ